MLVPPQTAQLVFVLSRPRGRFATLVSSLGELWAGQLPAMLSVDAMWDATRDRVLITAHYDARQLTEGVRTRINIIAREAGVVVIDGKNLEETDKTALVDGGEHKVDKQPALAIALWTLSRLMGGEEVWSGEPEPLSPSRPRAITANEIADRANNFDRRSRAIGIVPPTDPITPRTVTPGSLPAPARTRTPGSGPPPLPRTQTRPAAPPTGEPVGPLGQPPRTTTLELRDEIREEAAAAQKLLRGSRTSTLRDVVAPRAMGNRAAPSQPPQDVSLPPLTPAMSLDDLDLDEPQPEPPPEKLGRSIEDGTAPKVEIPGSARTSQSGFGARPSSTSQSGFRNPGPTPSQSQSGLKNPSPTASQSQSGLKKPGESNPGFKKQSQPGFGARPGSTSQSGFRSAKPTNPQPISNPRLDDPVTSGGTPAPEGLASARAASELGIPMGVAVPEPFELPLDASAPVPSLPSFPTRSSRSNLPILHEPPVMYEPPTTPVIPAPPRAPIIEARPETIDDRMDSGPVTVADPVRLAAALGTDAEMPSLDRRPDATHIDVRYLRSGRWAPARLRALSLKGAYLITAAFPRVGDHVHIALGLGDLGALVRGVVFHVTTAADIASTGTSGYAVRFDLDDAAKSQLSAVLHRARARGITITPPPPRGAIRLPVQWPVKLSTQRGAIKGDALDVSRHGMFVHAARNLDVDAPVSFSAVLDDGTSPVSGRARVVREVSESDAARRGLRAGFGLSIQEMGDSDLERWNLFLARVQRRSEHRILIGASPQRLAELTAGLAGAGYAVVGGTDTGTLLQLSEAEARPPDVAVIDATLLEGSDPNWLESMFSARKVPCVTLRGDTRRARVVVDRLLAV